MPSHIEPLFNAIAASPFRVAPEASDALATEVASLNLTLEFVDNPNKFAEYVPQTAIVRLGTQYLEVLWSAAHAFAIVFDEYEKANKRRETMFEVGGTERSRAAYELYRRILKDHVAGRALDWTGTVRPPVRFPEPNTDAHVANELFLTAISWVVHHEVAHARLGHVEFTVKAALNK